MSRYFLIHSADGVEHHYSDGDLPLTIGSGPDAHILIADGKEVEAYIGESRGHLFLQPATPTAPSVFHNDEIVTASVWIKSGDAIRIGNMVIAYKVSGDRIILTVLEQATDETSALIPPAMQPEERTLPRVNENEGEAKPWWKKRHTRPAVAVFFLLILGALFVLFAKPMEISITPEPDVFDLYGFPPPLKVGNQYLALKSTYIYSAEKEGYEKLVETLDLSRQSNRGQFTFTMQKLPGKITFISQPPLGVTIYADDIQVGATPMPEIELPAGTHRIRLEKLLYTTLEQAVSVEGLGKKQTFTFSLQPDWADVHLTSTPTGVAVTISDTVVGTTPCTIQLSSGSQTLIFSKSSFSASELMLDVVAGEAITSHVELQPAPALVTITSIPERTTVAIDGAFQGHTPLTVALTAEVEHRISVSVPGYSTKEERLILKPEEKKDIKLRLSPELGTVFLSIEPVGADVFIDRKEHILTTNRLELTTKEQVIEVRAKGYKTEKRTIVPKKGYSQQVAIHLKKASARGTGAGTPQFNVTPVGHELVLTKPSTFVMGAPRREPGRRANEREREITLNKPFYLSRKPVTNKEFRRFRKDHDSGAVKEYQLNGDNQPVVNVSWEDAVQFLNWLSRQEGLVPFYRESGDTFVPANQNAHGYRLPTEAEWAYAARIAARQKSDRFPWQGSFPPRKVTGNFADESARTLLPTIIGGYNDGFPVTSPVGTFPPNQAGFYDMGGNVSEWCHDYYTAYTSNTVKAVNPMGPESGTHRVIRGSSWRDSSIMELRLSYRGYHRKGQDYVGFRIARYP